MSKLSKMNARTLTLAHAENDAFNAAALASAADTVSAIGAPPDAPPVELTAADALPDTATADAAPPVTADAAPAVAVPRPSRVSLGAALASLTAAHAASVMFRGAPLNGAPTVKRSDAPTLTPVVLTAADAPELYETAVRMLASIGATIGTPSDVPDVSDFDSLAALYLGNRATATDPTGGYFHRNRGTIDRPAANTETRNGISPLDRLMYACRIAERCMNAADKLSNRKPRNASGGFNGTDAVLARRDSLAVLLMTDVTVA